MARRPIPKSIETDVLAQSRRRCCLCFGLHGDMDEKRGQIAHVDRKSDNNSLDNLAFLCLTCHDDYDRGASQSKCISPNELKVYRRELYERLESSQSATIRPNPADTAFVELRLGHKFEDYTDAQQNDLLNAIRTLLSVSEKIRVVSRFPGSVRLILETTLDTAEKLVGLANSEELLEYGVLSGHIVANLPEHIAEDSSITPWMIDVRNGVAVVTLNQALLLNEQDIDMLPKADDLPSNLVVIDFSNVEYLSSAAIGKLLTLDKQCKQARGQLVLVNLPKSAMEVFRITKFDRLFIIRTSVELAIEAINANK